MSFNPSYAPYATRRVSLNPLVQGKVNSWYNSNRKGIQKYRAAADSILTQEQNAAKDYTAKLSSKNARLRGASMRAGEAGLASSKLLAEFETGLAQKQLLRRAKKDKAVGALTASFGASGVASSGAITETGRMADLQANIQASQDNTQRQGIINQARSAITSSLASSQSGEIFQRSVSRAISVDRPQARTWEGELAQYQTGF